MPEKRGRALTGRESETQGASHFATHTRMHMPTPTHQTPTHMPTHTQHTDERASSMPWFQVSLPRGILKWQKGGWVQLMFRTFPNDFWAQTKHLFNRTRNHEIGR